MELSIVTTLYNSAPYLLEFYERISATASRVAEDCEIILVNDGSPDDSLQIALLLMETDERVRVIDLSRNFGHHMAFMAGLSQTRGQRVFVIDVDLEEQPEWLIDFTREFELHCVDVVYGVQHARIGGPMKAYPGRLFYRLFNILSDFKIPDSACTARLMSRRYVDSLLTLRDKNIFLAGNYSWTGYRQRPITVHKRPRPSPSTYTLTRTLALLVTSITSFSSRPLFFIFLLGLATSVLSAFVGLGIVLRKLLDPSTILLGWPSLMVSLWFLGGLVILSNGILGMYLSMIFAETKDRPPYIIRSLYESPRRATDGQAPPR